MGNMGNIHPRLIGDHWYLCVVFSGRLLRLQKLGLAGNCINFGRVY